MSINPIEADFRKEYARLLREFKEDLDYIDDYYDKESKLIAADKTLSYAKKKKKMEACEWMHIFEKKNTTDSYRMNIESLIKTYQEELEYYYEKEREYMEHLVWQDFMLRMLDDPNW